MSKLRRPDPTPSPLASGSTRRELLARVSAFGVGAIFAPVSRWTTARDPRARGVIQVFLRGGLSHIDTFDPKPDAPIEVRGTFRAIPTAVDGLQFSELCPDLARVADRMVVIRSVTHTEAAHERGTTNMLTGYRPSPAIAYPGFGAVISHELGVRNDVPPYVAIPGPEVPDLGTGYLSSAYGPFSVGGDPARKEFRVLDLAPAADLGEARGRRRREILDALDGGFEQRTDAIAATQAFYRQAWEMIGSPAAREAFRLDLEGDAMRDRYGRTPFGQRLLLARRLIEAGARYVCVVSGGWDHHQKLADGLRAQMPPVDRGVAALIGDLDERRILDHTMVLLTTEFGRTPRGNPDAGRDHWPRVFSVLAAGGGLKRGLVFGASDASGSEPEDAPVRPGDIAATMYSQLGIDPRKRLMSPGDRPIDIVREGEVIEEIRA